MVGLTGSLQTHICFTDNLFISHSMKLNERNIWSALGFVHYCDQHTSVIYSAFYTINKHWNLTSISRKSEHQDALFGSSYLLSIQTELVMLSLNIFSRSICFIHCSLFETPCIIILSAGRTASSSGTAHLCGLPGNQRASPKSSLKSTANRSVEMAMPLLVSPSCAEL